MTLDVSEREVVVLDEQRVVVRNVAGRDDVGVATVVAVSPVAQHDGLASHTGLTREVVVVGSRDEASSNHNEQSDHDVTEVGVHEREHERSNLSEVGVAFGVGANG